MAHDIEQWLDELGLAKYAARFAENEVDLEVLRELTEEDLEGLDIPLGPRKQLLKAIAVLSTGAGTLDLGVGIDAGAALRRHDGERRQLTVMFCDIVESTALSTRIDPEDLRDVVREYHDACAKVVARYEGYVAKCLGDGVLV